jgi:hypothetical protein
MKIECGTWFKHLIFHTPDFIYKLINCRPERLVNQFVIYDLKSFNFTGEKREVVFFDFQNCSPSCIKFFEIFNASTRLQIYLAL